jgi:L-fuculose-phosphate aldolase
MSSGEDIGTQEVVDTCRSLASAGLVIGEAGNVSLRLSDDRIAVTASGARFDRIEPTQITIVDNDGQVVDGAPRPTSELRLHLGILDARGAQAVVHTHSPYGAALSTVVDEIPAVHYAILMLGGPVKVAPYATFGTQELADVTVKAMEGRSAALMANHGAVVFGSSLAQATEQAMLLEWLCEMYWRARQIGNPSTLSAAQLEDVIRRAMEQRYGGVRTDPAPDGAKASR